MRYFFNLTGSIYDPDNEGIELPSMADARTMAAVHAGDLIRDDPRFVWAGEDFRVEVTDASQLLLFTVVVLGVDAPAGIGR